MKVKVCLEVGPQATGVFVPDFPGCWVFGRDQESALDKVKTAVERWHLWARGHGEDIESPSSVEIDPTEVMHVPYNPAEAGKPEPLFWSEILPVRARDVNRTLRLMKHSRSDLMELCSGLERGELSWKPEGEPRSISGSLRHIAIAERWYVSRLDIDLPKSFPKDVFQALQWARELAVDSLRSLSKRQRSEIFQPRNDPSPTCNLWTARKVLRRIVDHERLHTAYVEKILRANESKS